MGKEMKAKQRLESRRGKEREKGAKSSAGRRVIMSLSGSVTRIIFYLQPGRGGLLLRND